MEDNYQAQPAPQSSQDVGFPTPREPKHGNNMIKILILVVGLVLIIGAGGYFLLRGDSDNGDLMAEPTPFSSLSDLPTTEPTSSPSPEPTESPTVAKSEINISVLNGTGVPGEASFLKTELGKLGYTEVEAGNASSQDETRTTVTYSSKVSDSMADEITKRLEALYTEVRTKKGSVSDADIEIITGPRKGSASATATPKASATATPKATSTASPSPTAN